MEAAAKAETMLDRIMISGELPDPPIAQLLGVRVISVLPGESRLELDAGPQHANPMGTLHGGVLCDLADLAMGAAYASTLERGETFTTVELKINFLRPVWKEKLFAMGKIVNRGRTVGMVECDITDSQGRLVAKAASTCLTLQKERHRNR
ncbi:MAG: PaaI family thioesterase [Thermodesulfobacteriota bacterium]